MNVAAAPRQAVRIARLVREARSRARAAGTRVLVSVVDRVRDVGPGAVLAAAAALPNTQPAPLAGDRMLWMRPDDGFALVGLGVAARLDASAISRAEAPEQDRFTIVGRAWERLRDHALVDDQSAGAVGAGPVLMGGFSFAPEGPVSPRWRDFSAASLILPRVQLARGERACWITTNILVAPDGTVDVDPVALSSAVRALLGASAADRARAPAAGSAPLRMADARPRSDWEAMVRAATRTIGDGALEKVVLAREVQVRAPRAFDIHEALAHLAGVHPSCFVFGCWRGESVFLGASPERLVRLDGREVRTSSLAGSAPRGSSAAEDRALAMQLLASAKDRREHEIVRRVLCAELTDLCDEVSADAAPALLSVAQLHHLHTEVRGRLREGRSLLDVVGQLHPTPAVGGEPREKALRFIREHEQLDRGWYAAPIGWLQEGRGEFAVGLRSALVRGSEAVLFAGCGIVGDSDPALEYEESTLKLQPMQSALSTSVSSAAVPPRVSCEGAAS